MKKRIVTSTGIAILMVVIPGAAALAQEIPVVSAAVPMPEPALELTNSTSTDSLIAQGEKLIDARLLSLNKAKTRIGKTNLTTDQKNSLTSSIDTQIQGLTNLRGQIASSSDLSTLKGYVTSIFTDYRIYGVFAPKIQLLGNLYHDQNYSARLDTLFAQAQTKINNAKNQGTTTVDRQAALDKAKAINDSIKPKIASLIDQANTLKPADYGTTSQNLIKDVNTGIKDVNASFRQIIQDLRQGVVAKAKVANLTKKWQWNKKMFNVHKKK